MTHTMYILLRRDIPNIQCSTEDPYGLQWVPRIRCCTVINVVGDVPGDQARVVLLH